MDWLDLLAVQGTLKSLLQHHSSKASIFRHSAFFTVQLSHPYMTTGKTIALTRWTFVGKAMSLLFNMLSRLVITFLPRSKRLLISWLQSPSAVILEPPKIESDTVSTVSPSISHEVMGPDAMMLVFWMLSFKPLLSYKKECMWISSNDMDEPTAYYAEWSKSEKENKYHNIHMESRKVVLRNLCAGRQRRCRHREQTYGPRGGRKGWYKLTE